MHPILRTDQRFRVLRPNGKTTVGVLVALLELPENKKAEQADGKPKNRFSTRKKLAFFAQLAIICEIGLKKAKNSQYF